jgi:type IX secretion system PorP/SprF family membrane protein
MKFKLILFGFLFITVLGYSQQDAQYTQYMYNTSNINPAYAGSRGVFSGLVMHRNQWIGLEGAPVTNTATIHTPLKEDSKFGIGLSVVNDKLGPSNENTLSLDLSYTIPTSENFKLSFGIKGSANFYSVDFNKLRAFNPAEKPVDDSRFSPNVGAGLFWYSDKTYIGISVPYLLQHKYYDNDIQYVASERMHFFAILGHVFDLSDTVKFKPAGLVKVVNGAPLQVDLSGNFLFFDKLTLGAAYRWSAAVSGMAGFQITNTLLVGYAYDKETTRLGNFNSGSHEIFLRFELLKNYKKIVSPRFF